jgi:hypothetical protein
MVARLLRDGLEQREDLPFAQDPFGQLLFELGSADGGADVCETAKRMRLT